MTRRTTNLTDRLYEYLLSVSLGEPELFRRLRDEMAGHPYSNSRVDISLVQIGDGLTLARKCA